MRALLAVLSIAAILLCRPAYAAAHDTRHELRVLTTDVVEYTCVTTATNETQNIKVKVTLTMPTSTTVDSELSIGWQGAYADGTSLKTPATGLEDNTKLYAYAGISDFSGLTSATGVGTLDATTPGETITLPAGQVSLLTTPNGEGTGTVRPGAINFGTTANEPAIECDVDNREDLTTYTLKVPTSGQDTDPDDTTSPSPSPDETDDPDDNTGDDTSSTPTSTVTTTTTETPAGGADTGAGGMAGPDGRALILVGFVVMLAAAVGLSLRRVARA
ncbi:hypothetical protein AB0I81_18565 [Nonomuraea sp. NPDC050404]|uniref:hypothetical protein n=1 Tax=Nonomuraea sp. NPDC050404 TaxID=3155783 RepID=UPI0033E41747